MMKFEAEIGSERIQLYSPRFRNRGRNIIRTIKRIFGDRKNIRVFDAGCGEVLEHIPEDIQALLNLKTALKPNDRIIITVPNNLDAWSVDDELPGHVCRYSRAEIVDKLIKCGYKKSR